MPERPSVTLLRPGLELAWWVAKLGGQARPAIEPPGRMRPFMKAAKLPVRYLEGIRQVVDDDEDFRSRVAAAATEEVLGRASWLWLARPDGWEAELATLGRAASDVDPEKGERAARRQLERSQADLMRLRAEVVVLQQANKELGAAAKQDAQARRRVESDRDRLQTELQQTRAASAALAAAAADHQTQLDAMAGAAGAAEEGRTEALAAQERLEAENAALRASLAAAGAEASARSVQSEADRAAAGAAWQRADQAAASLVAALDELGQAAGVPPERPRNVELDSSRPAAPAGERIEFDITGPPGAPAEPRRRRRRMPIALPPAVFDDSVEAADFLVRHPGILLVVDGYNVTLASWPGLDLPEQRQRLIDALAELTARASTTVHVVFDGVDAGGRLRPPSVARRRLRVEFSPSEVEADQLIIDLVDRLDPAQGAVVATNDRRVREEVARRGANVIAVSQLLAVIGRARYGR